MAAGAKWTMEGLVYWIRTGKVYVFTFVIFQVWQFPLRYVCMAYTLRRHATQGRKAEKMLIGNSK